MAAPHDDLAPLSPLLGEWVIEVDLPGATGAAGRVINEWALGGAFLLQRSEAPDPFPSGLIVTAPDADAGGFREHYFDSRGVVRLYRMTFADGEWTRLREADDFTPLDFAQRFFGTLSAEGDRIDARWEKARTPGEWELDFRLTYTRVD